MDNVNLNTFPNGKVEAITMLYLQNQNLEGKTPEELVSLYEETLIKVQHAFYEKSKIAKGFIG